MQALPEHGLFISRAEFNAIGGQISKLFGAAHRPGLNTAVQTQSFRFHGEANNG